MKKTLMKLFLSRKVRKGRMTKKLEVVMKNRMINSLSPGIDNQNKFKNFD